MKRAIEIIEQLENRNDPPAGDGEFSRPGGTSIWLKTIKMNK